MSHAYILLFNFVFKKIKNSQKVVKNNTERLLFLSKETDVLFPFHPPNATENPGHRETDGQVGANEGPLDLRSPGG